MIKVTLIKITNETRITVMIEGLTDNWDNTNVKYCDDWEEFF